MHFNSSRDDTLFASDGGDASQVAYATDGMWINLLRVQANETVAREPLVNMSRHNHVTGQFAPGQRHVYAVEIGKPNSGPRQ